MLKPDELLEQTQWDLFWLPSDVSVVERPEISYTVCPRDAAGLNVVAKLRAKTELYPKLVEEVAEAHRLVESRFTVCPQNASTALTSALERGGYQPQYEHDGYTLSVEDAPVRTQSTVRVVAVSTRAQLADAMKVRALAFGLDEQLCEDELTSYFAGCTGPQARAHRFLACDARSGEPIASAGMTSFPRLHFGFLWAGGTKPEARGKGAYRALVSARIAAAKQLGLTRVGLYARLGTSAPIVAKQGFTRHGRMSFWTKPAGEPRSSC